MAGGDLEVRLLGSFDVLVDGRMVAGEEWERRSAADLVKLLALAHRHRLTRDQVAEALWPSLEPRAAWANIRKAAHFARRALADDRAVVLTSGLVELAPDRELVTDVERFEDASTLAEGGGDPAAYRLAAELYGGELLPDDRYADWCDPDRARLEAVYLRDLAGARLWGRLVDADPASELAHREIMRGQVARGDRRAALRQFEMLRAALAEAGLVPDHETMQVYEEALLGDERSDAPTPAERARALLAWGVVHWERADLVEAERTANEVRALAIDAGLGRELVEASELLGLVAYAQGTWREHFGKTVVDTIRATPELMPFVYDAHVCMSEFSLSEEGGLGAAAELSAKILEAAEEVSSDQGVALARLLQGESDLLAGRLDVARSHLDEAMRLNQLLGHDNGLCISAERLAQLDDLAGGEGGAGTLHRRALELAGSSPLAGHLIPFVYGGMLSAPSETGTELLHEAERAVGAIETCESCSMSLHIAAVRLLAGSGDLGRARAHLADAERIAQRWRGGHWHAALSESKATLREAEGADGAELEGLLLAAAASYRAEGRHREALRCEAVATRAGESRNVPGTAAP
jgi:DNA-binding SARP family transcriptional activator